MTKRQLEMPDDFWQELVESFEGLDSHNEGLKEEDQLTQVQYARQGVIDIFRDKVRKHRDRQARDAVTPVTAELTIT